MAPQAGLVGNATVFSSVAGPSTSLNSTDVFSSEVFANATNTLVYNSSRPATTTSAVPTGSPTAYSSGLVTTTIVLGNATSIVIGVPAGSIFTSLPTATPLPESGTISPNGGGLSGWKAFLVAFFTILAFFLLLRLGIYYLTRRGSTMMTAWPRWLQVLCCYKPPDEDEFDSMEEPRLVRQSYLEGGSYSEASRAQALALVREQSVGYWRSRIRRPQRPISPSQDDPVPPYPGPPLTPAADPFLDQTQSEAEEDKESSKESESSPTRPSGSRPRAS